MNIFMLPYFVTALLLTSQNPATFKFSDPIEFFNLGKDSDFYAYKSKDNKILVIKPKKNVFDVTMSVITSKSNYQFRLISSNNHKNSLYIVQDAKNDKIYSLVTDNKKFKLTKGEHTLKLINKTSTPLRVNDIEYHQKILTLPYGTYLKINNETIHY